MLKQAKKATLGLLQSTGVSTLIKNSRWRRQRLLILAYHSISFSDEHQWRSGQFMEADFFRSRMQLLKKFGCSVLPLGEAVSRLYADDLPERAVAITFDDGTSDFYHKAFPILREFNFPVTLYLTTFYTQFNRPVFDLMCSYLLWKGREKTIELSLIGQTSKIDLRSDAAREDAFIQIDAFTRANKMTAEEKDALLSSLAAQVGVDYESLSGERALHNLTPNEVRMLAEAGIDIQLHTHRHRTPLDRELFIREIEDNRRSIHAMTGKSTSHFCYPSGVSNVLFPPWLQESGIVSATTCEPGLASRDSDPMLLPRLLDIPSLSEVEFEGWLNGISSFLPRRRQKLEYHPPSPVSGGRGKNPDKNEAPMVTIAIPCLNEARFIERCLRDALAQSYPADRLEVLVADGGSRDGTREILAKLAEADRRLRGIDNPGRIQARGMNAILRVARGSVIVRMDAHSEYAPDYVAQCVAELKRTGADNVGGAARARAASLFQHSLCAALDSPLGVGGAGYRRPDQEGFVDTVFNGAFPRAVFERVGLYDPSAVVNEDAELNQRIAAAGGRIYLSRRIVAHYYPRESLSGLATQYFRYGQGRARTILKGRRFPRLRNIGPFLAVVIGGMLLIAAPRSALTRGLALVYALATGLEAVRVARYRPQARALAVWVMFPVIHLAHGSGMLVGLIRYAFWPDWGPLERLPPRAEA